MENMIKISFIKKIKRKINDISNWLSSQFGTKIAIDVDSINNISQGGKRVDVYHIIQLYRKKGVFVYKSSDGNKPIVLSRGIISRPVKIIDYDKLNDRDKEKLLIKHKMKSIKHQLMDFIDNYLDPMDFKIDTEKGPVTLNERTLKELFKHFVNKFYEK